MAITQAVQRPGQQVKSAKSARVQLVALLALFVQWDGVVPCKRGLSPGAQRSTLAMTQGALVKVLRLSTSQKWWRPRMDSCDMPPRASGRYSRDRKKTVGFGEAYPDGHPAVTAVTTARSRRGRPGRYSPLLPWPVALLLVTPVTASCAPKERVYSLRLGLLDDRLSL